MDSIWNPSDVFEKSGMNLSLKTVSNFLVFHLVYIYIYIYIERERERESKFSDESIKLETYMYVRTK